MMRALVFFVGAGLLSAATWTAIDAAKLEGAHAVLVGALACGTAAGAIVIARSSWRVGIAVALAVLCGEAFGMLATAERIIAQREALAGAIVAEDQTARAAASHISDAEAAISAHDDIARTKVAERGCADNCRMLLDKTRTELVRELEAARKVKVGQIGRSSTPLADRLGIEAWKLDLLAAALMSLGANGMACILIAWAAHTPRAFLLVPTKTPSKAEAVEQPKPKPSRANVVDMQPGASVRTATEFALTSLIAADGARTSLTDIARRYGEYCASKGLSRPTPEQIADHIERVMTKTGIAVTTNGGIVYAMGVKLAA